MSLANVPPGPGPGIASALTGCPSRLLWLAAISASMLVTGGLASAQTLIPGDHHLRLGEPPLLTVKARLPADQAPAGLLPHRCLSASLQPIDPRDGAAVELQWHDAERHADGSTWVTFIHPDPLRLLRMMLRATLHCGPSYTRQQVLQAQPELADESNKVDLVPIAPARPTAMLPTPRPDPPAPSPLPSKPATPSRPSRPPVPMQVTAPEAGTTSATIAWREPTVAPPSRTSPPEPMLSASPLTDAFVQVWQHDLRQLKDELAPLRHQLAAQELRLGAQEDLRRDGLIGLLIVGASVLAARMFGRTWRETRLRRIHRDGTTQVATPPRADKDSHTDSHTDGNMGDDMDSDWIGKRHPEASATSVCPPEPATLDEARHQALFDEVDALRGTGHLEAAIALLETAQDGEIERPPGLLLRLIDLYLRLAQTEQQTRTMQELSRLYAVDVPDPEACRLIEELDPSGARRALIAAMPAWSDRSDAPGPARHTLRQHLSAALLGNVDGLRLGWRDFQTAWAWHAELAAEADGQTSTRSMPPELACCT